MLFSIICWCGGLIGLFYFIYWIFFVPINLTRGLNEISYNFTGKIKNYENKQNAINQCRRLRKIKNKNENIPPPFPNGWYAIAESENVPAGQAISVACLGEQFVVFRTNEMIIHVLDTYCPHMGANLGINGKVIGDNIECPFHQWQFNGTNGQCTNIPYSTSCDIPKSAKLKTWISKELSDFIFIWYHAEENETPWILPIVKELESNSICYIGRNEYFVNCHIQDIPENGADLSHFSSVHGANIIAGNDTKLKWTLSLGTHKWDAIWKSSASHTANITLQHSLKLFDNLEICTLEVHGHQIGPAYVILNVETSFGNILIVQTIVPVDRLLQKVIHRFYGTKIKAPLIKCFIFAESIMFERDINIWNHKQFTNSPCLVKEDRNIKMFRNWFSQFYTENSKTFTAASEDLNW